MFGLPALQVRCRAPPLGEANVLSEGNSCSAAAVRSVESVSRYSSITRPPLFPDSARLIILDGGITQPVEVCNHAIALLKTLGTCMCCGGRMRRFWTNLLLLSSKPVIPVLTGLKTGLKGGEQVD